MKNFLKTVSIVSFIPFLVFGHFWRRIFVYILQGKMKKKRKENHATKVTKIPKSKRQKYDINETLVATFLFWTVPLVVMANACFYSCMLESESGYTLKLWTSCSYLYLYVSGSVLPKKKDWEGFQSYKGQFISKALVGILNSSKNWVQTCEVFLNSANRAKIWKSANHLKTEIFF